MKSNKLKQETRDQPRENKRPIEAAKKSNRTRSESGSGWKTVIMTPEETKPKR